MGRGRCVSPAAVESRMQQPSREQLPISYVSPGRRHWSRLRHATAQISGLVTVIASAVSISRLALAVAPPLRRIPSLEWVAAGFVAVMVIVSISLGVLVERVINRGNAPDDRDRQPPRGADGP